MNHEISVTATLEKNYQKNVDWQIQLISGICQVLNDDTKSSVVVREIRPQGSQELPRSFIFVYTNDTMPKDKCPEEHLQELVSQINVNDLNEVLNSDIRVSTVSGEQTGNCQKTVKKPKMEVHRNFPPLTRNQVDRVSATVGQLLVFKVPHVSKFLG